MVVATIRDGPLEHGLEFKFALESTLLMSKIVL